MIKKIIPSVLALSLLVNPLGAHAYGPHQLTSMLNIATGEIAVTFEYDANGNITVKNDIENGKYWQYDYSVDNRLIAVYCNSKLIEEYQYDDAGGRTVKTSYKTDGPPQPIGSPPQIDSKITFAGKLFEKITDVNGVTQLTHIYMNGSRVATVSAGEVAYYHNDHLGGTSVMTNAAGQVIENAGYEPYGKIVYNPKYTATKNAKSYYFTGKYLDSKTGLYHYGARYYDPATARFITPDSIVQNAGSSQTFNRYSYAGNNPSTNIDPTGHFFFAFIAAAVKWAIATAIAHPIIVGAAVAGGASMAKSMANGDNYFQAYSKAVVPTAVGGAMGGLGAAAPGTGAWGAAKFAVAGGMIGGAGSLASGSSFGQGFLAGAIGGAATWAGGSIMAQKFAGAGLLGNIISSGGMSSVESGVRGQSWNSNYTIFAGPLSVSLSKGAKPSFGLSSFSSAFYLAKGIAGSARFDLWNTLSSGTPVFRTEYGGTGGRFGRTMGNVVFLGPAGLTSGQSVTGNKQWVLGHERIHANIQGRMGGAWGPLATEAVEQTSQAQSWWGSVAEGSHRQIPALGEANVNAFEIQAGSFALWGE